MVGSAAGAIRIKSASRCMDRPTQKKASPSGSKARLLEATHPASLADRVRCFRYGTWLGRCVPCDEGKLNLPRLQRKPSTAPKRCRCHFHREYRKADADSSAMTARGTFRLYQVQNPSTRANAAVGYAHNRRHYWHAEARAPKRAFLHPLHRATQMQARRWPRRGHSS
jgi:hypothetical protein